MEQSPQQQSPPLRLQPQQEVTSHLKACSLVQSASGDAPPAEMRKELLDMTALGVLKIPCCAFSELWSCTRASLP
eukprot:4215680-Amphidinium_carterae.1